jgi:hypothetical protein
MQEMERQGITKATLAERMHTSRAQVDRIAESEGQRYDRDPLVGRELHLEPVRTRAGAYAGDKFSGWCYSMPLTCVAFGGHLDCLIISRSRSTVSIGEARCSIR